MLDFTPVHKKEVTLAQFVEGLTREDLVNLTNEMVDTMLALIEDCVDADVTFVPDDPDAHDPAAATEAEVDIPWTLGHVIVHTTASAEENAFIAAELARGAPFHGRSRHEVHWQSMHTIEQCRHRLEESRRMRLATLDVWPDEPYLENYYQRTPESPKINAIAYFVGGLRHDDSHLEQIAGIVKQAKRARGEK